MQCSEDGHIGEEHTTSFSDYDAFLSTGARIFTQPIGDLADTINVPLISALLFGLIGALAPCQLSTNLTALAWVSLGAGNHGKVARAAGIVFLLVGLNETVLYWLL